MWRSRCFHESKGTGTSLFHVSTCVTFAAVPVAVSSRVHDQARQRGQGAGAWDCMTSHRLSQVAGEGGQHDHVISETRITVTPGSPRKSECREAAVGKGRLLPIQEQKREAPEGTRLLCAEASSPWGRSPELLSLLPYSHLHLPASVRRLEGSASFERRSRAHVHEPRSRPQG